LILLLLLLLIQATTTAGRRLQQLVYTTYIVLASTTRDWQALQTAVSSSSLPPLLTATIANFGRSLVGPPSECAVLGLQ
jgi:hypothetical protein